MAIFGRGQPHQPIFLRTAAAAIVVAATAAMPLRVVLAEQHPVAKTRVVYVRPNRTSLVPDRLAPQIHVILAAIPTWRHPAREADVIFLRTAVAPPVVATPAPQIHVVRANPVAFRHPAREADVISLRAPPPQPGAPPIHVVGLQRNKVPRITARPGVLVVHNPQTQPATVALPRPVVVLVKRPPTAGHIVQARNPQAPVVAAVATGSPIHVLVQPRERAVPKGLVAIGRNPQTQPATVALPKPTIVLAHRRPAVGHVVQVRAPQAPAVTSAKPVAPVVVLAPRERAIAKGLVAYVRPSRTSFVPDRLPVQVHVVQAVPLAAWHPARASDPTFRARRVIFLRAPLAPPPAHQITVVSRKRLQQITVERRASVVTLRTTVPVPPTIQSHVVLQPRERAIPRGRVVTFHAPTIVAAVAVKAAPVHVFSTAGARAAQRTRAGHVLFLRPGRVIVVGGDIAARAVKLREQPVEARKLRPVTAYGEATYFDGVFFYDGIIFFDGSLQPQGLIKTAPVIRARKLKDV